MIGKRIAYWLAPVILSMTAVGCAVRESSIEPALAEILANRVSGTLPPAQSTSEDSSKNRSSISKVQYVEQNAAATPFSIRDANSPHWTPPAKWDLTIDQAIQIALANSTVLRDLGARVVQAPGLTPTIYGPAIQTTDATTGIEAALSEFDAQVTTDLFFEDNDRFLNNEILGQGVNNFQQELARFQSALSKRAATGTQFSLRHNFDGDLNNAQNLLEGRAWTWDLEAEVRQPLLQGRGARFNRIAGPNATPGVYNGVLIARLNADISIAQLEVALRDYLSEVENAYWDLAFAYADLEVKKKARDRSLETYRNLKARADQRLLGAESDKLAQAKEQYFRFEQDVQDALAGRLVVGTRTFNGSGGGTFQGVGGVYSNERRLRLIMGLPINDGQLIHTSTTPTSAPASYDWESVVSNALSRRTELRQQQLNVERRELELTASRNFTLPRLDAVGTYRYRALGDRIYDPHIPDPNPLTSNIIDSGTFEWRMGLSLAYPVGYRKAHAAVRSAQLRLARERDLLRETERQVVYGISNAIAENDRAYEVLRLARNRTEAARQQYEILVSKAETEIRQFDFNALLDSERRLAEAESNENRAGVQYALATKNLNFEMGTLLEYFNIHLAEGNWPRRRKSSAGGIGAMYEDVIKVTPEEEFRSAPLESQPATVPSVLDPNAPVADAIGGDAAAIEQSPAGNRSPVPEDLPAFNGAAAEEPNPGPQEAPSPERIEEVPVPEPLPAPR